MLTVNAGVSDASKISDIVSNIVCFVALLLGPFAWLAYRVGTERSKVSGKN